MTREEVRAVDSWAIDQIGVPGVVLMENAGRSCAELIKEKLAGVDNPRVCIFCGTGNNGGDGYVIARHLINAGFAVKVLLHGPQEKMRNDARVNHGILKRLGHAVQPFDAAATDLCAQVRSLAGDADLIVDALFGTGLQGELHEPYRSLIDSINALGRLILAVDIPSGLDCDTGRPLGTAIQATYTVTFVAVKKGFVACPDARKYLGELYIASIGVEPPANDSNTLKFRSPDSPRR
ncbi:MAG: NAD(P)H-hydrate epimerase [Sedimentisphaerales bacterium]|nr:NAD(P)H-hydrate epimerase [Sedimentisphaerales bacterium]